MLICHTHKSRSASTLCAEMYEFCLFTYYLETTNQVVFDSLQLFTFDLIN